MAGAQALLYTLMTPTAGIEEAFDAWHDEHMRHRTELPGFLNGRRYRMIDPQDGLRYLVYYDLEDASALQSTEYQALRAGEAASDRDRSMLAGLTQVQRRVYRLIDTDEPWAAPWTEHAPFVMSVALEPPQGQEAGFHAWYREEHSPMLMAAKGWQRIRRFEQAEGDGPRFMALHELETLDGFKTDAYTAALSTPWRLRVTGAVVRRERFIFELARGISGLML